MEKEIELREAFIDNIIRYMLDENLPRVIKCLEMLSEEEIWFRPNAVSNSVGNLVLHLCGNLRQWVLKGIGNQNTVRNREEEFEADRSKSKEELLNLLRTSAIEVRICILEVDIDQLLRIRPVQVYEESGMTILVHVTEHFSYHTGQIAYITKWLKNEQTNFYAGVNLNV